MCSQVEQQNNFSFVSFLNFSIIFWGIEIKRVAGSENITLEYHKLMAV